MKFLKLIPIFLIFIVLAGCLKGALAGGLGDYNQEQTIVTDNPDGSKTTTTTTTHANIQSPQGTNKPAVMTVTPTKEGIKVQYQTGTSYNIDQIMENAKLLRIPMYAGLALLVAGALVLIFTKDIVWASIIGGTGIIMCVGSYLLAEYALYFLIGLGVIACFGIYHIVRYVKINTAHNENVELIEKGMERGIIKTDEFKTMADDLQSKSTKKLVDQVQTKIAIEEAKK